jgi:NAD(P)-dependent dehydrogenase (short-subunit alcohol dehydrogenase family)
VKVAVVTGGSSGIGAATARVLAARGWRCVLLARGRERLERVAAEIGAEAEACDVGDRGQVEEAARRIGERHPAVQLLVNNAGIPAGGSFLELDAHRIEEVTRTNYLGSVWSARAFLSLLEAGAPSDLVNVVSVAGLVGRSGSGPYAASKAAQLAFSRGIAAELGRHGVRVHSVSPGPVQTPGFPHDRIRRRRLGRRVVLQPERIAEAILAAVEHDRAEVVIPPIFRLPTAAHALFPGTLTRLLARRRST